MALLLVTGTRFADMGHAWDIYQAITAITGQPTQRGGHTVYVGDADGVDLVVRQTLRSGPHAALWVVRQFEARWDDCPLAGPRRNRRMVTQFAADGGTDALALPNVGGSLTHSGTWG